MAPVRPTRNVPAWLRGTSTDHSPDREETESDADSAEDGRDAVRQPGPVNVRAGQASNTKEIRTREAAEDRELVSRAQNGDATAFRKLVDRHQRRAYGIALGLVRDENDAREIVQDAFVRVFKGLSTFQNNSSFFTWLYRIITNLSIDLMRKPGRQRGEINEERLDRDETSELDFPLLSRIDGSDPLDVVRRREIASRLERALAELPTYHRSVIVMREVDGLSYDEMAEAMGVSKGTIMSRLFHARQKLQKALADCYGEQVGLELTSEALEGSTAVGDADGRGAG